MHICLTSPAPIQLRQQSDGQWSATGMGGPLIQLFIDLTYKLFTNTTYLYAKEQAECMERLKTNASDTSSVLRFLDENPRDYSIPVVMTDSQISFTTGHSVDSLVPKGSKNDGTAISNFALMDAQVQAIFLLFFFLMVICVVIRTVIRWKKCELMRKKRTITLWMKVRSEVRRFIYGASRTFRWASFLLAILIFYLITSFMISYKTSHVVVEKPYIVSSYVEMLRDATSLPVFWNFLYSKSEIFSKSPKDSLKGRIWQKLMKSGNNLHYHVRDTIDNDLMSINNIFKTMNTSHYVFICSSDDIEVWRGFICAMSPEGEIRRLLRFADASEPARLVGFPVTKFLADARTVTSRFRQVTEHGMYDLVFEMAKIVMMRMMFNVLQASTKHQHEQTLACDDEFIIEDEPIVAAISPHYFISFFHSTLVVFAAAFLILLIEIFCHKSRAARKRVARRRRPINRLETRLKWSPYPY